MNVQTGQARLAGIEQVLCKCGCGKYFMAAKTPRMREYLNDTHKKRAARARAKERRTDSRVKLTPKGWLYLHAPGDRERQVLWELMSEPEQAVIKLICETGLEPLAIKAAAGMLFGTDYDE